MRCVICNKSYEGDGNNAQPIMKGDCCDDCDSTIIIPERLIENKGDDEK